MILRSLVEAIRNQDWFTVLVEFFIVVLGIIIDLQFDGWNQIRNDRTKEKGFSAAYTP